jgi:hypothetical protein
MVEQSGHHIDVTSPGVKRQHVTNRRAGPTALHPCHSASACSAANGLEGCRSPSGANRVSVVLSGLCRSGLRARFVAPLVDALAGAAARPSAGCDAGTRESEHLRNGRARSRLDEMDAQGPGGCAVAFTEPNDSSFRSTYATAGRKWSSDLPCARSREMPPALCTGPRRRALAETCAARSRGAGATAFVRSTEV